jgi:hypothetical protein
MLLLLFLALLSAPWCALGQDGHDHGFSRRGVPQQHEGGLEDLLKNLPHGWQAVVVYPGPLPGTYDQIRRNYPPPLWHDQKVVWGVGAWSDWKNQQTQTAVFCVLPGAWAGQKVDKIGYYVCADGRAHKVAIIQKKGFFERRVWGPLKRVVFGHGISAFLAELLTHGATRVLPLGGEHGH